MNMKIARDEWPSFADSFSEANQGRPISIERVSETVVSETITEETPFMALDFDTEAPDTLLITVGEGEEAALTHTITSPETLWHYTDAGGKALSLEITTADGVKTILRFEDA